MPSLTILKLKVLDLLPVLSGSCGVLHGRQC